MDGDITHDWVKIFDGMRLSDGSDLFIVQTSWMNVELTVYPDSGCLMKMQPVRVSQGDPKKGVAVKPHFLLLRNQVRGPYPSNDRRNLIYGLMMANIPSINSCVSEYMHLERPIMYGALKEIESRVGHDKFPLIPITYYSAPNEMIIGPDPYPIIIKVSHSHAGMGKIKINDPDQFRDISTVLALNQDYCTAESFIKAEYGIRVQKVGSSYRVYKKIATGSGWKSQFGGADLQVIPLTDEFKLWADECSKCFGGMDLLAVDALHGEDGRDHIIELNGTAIGIKAIHWEEDTKVLRDLCIERMSALYCH